MLGVKTRYQDMAKCWQDASPESLLGVLRTLGVPVERAADAPAALRAQRHADIQRILEPVHVAWRKQQSTIPLQLPDSLATGLVRCEWRLSGSETRASETRLGRLPVERHRRVDGAGFTTRLLRVPPGLPVGYHQLVVELGNGRFETQIFCAPERCYQGESTGPRWGLFAPLYAVHSATSWGAGDFGDLTQLIDWTSEQGGSFVGTLPLLPAFLDQPCEPSPYSPLSRLYWNEFYVDVERVPEFETCGAARRMRQSPDFQRSLRKLRQAPCVDYAAQMALKRQVMEAMCRRFYAIPSARRLAFERFVNDHPQVRDYAGFRAHHEQHAGSWTTWPTRLRDGELRDSDTRRSLRQYHLYAQWLAHEQMAQLSETAREKGVDLYLDMPLGTHRDGYDAWRYQNLFALEASGGAPPDPVFTQGQDWGFAPIHPQRSRDQGHAYIRSYLQHHLQHARMLRFDHVMGLHRLYWVPRGMPARQGAYVQYPADEIYAMLSIESHRHQSIIIGENLGTVPAEVGRSLKRHGVQGMFVLQYELNPKARLTVRRIPPDVVASLNTHDMPPFAAFWEGTDIADRHRLGLIRRRDLPQEYLNRDRIRRSLVRWLRHLGRLGGGPVDVGAVIRATLAHLLDSRARWTILNLEDLWNETASQNTPGTSTERLNWRRKLRLSLEELRAKRIIPTRPIRPNRQNPVTTTD